MWFVFGPFPMFLECLLINLHTKSHSLFQTHLRSPLWQGDSMKQSPAPYSLWDKCPPSTHSILHCVVTFHSSLGMSVRNISGICTSHTSVLKDRRCSIWMHQNEVTESLNSGSFPAYFFVWLNCSVLVNYLLTAFLRIQILKQFMLRGLDYRLILVLL